MGYISNFSNIFKLAILLQCYWVDNEIKYIQVDTNDEFDQNIPIIVEKIH